MQFPKEPNILHAAIVADASVNDQMNSRPSIQR
jgi:hypothetical protein